MYGREFTNALREAWDITTSSDPHNWTHDVPEWGQCAVTALVVQERFGGIILCVDLTSAHLALRPEIAAMMIHCLNILPDGKKLDLTLKQFGDHAEDIARGPYREHTRHHLLDNMRIEARYQRLKVRLNYVLGLMGGRRIA